MSWFDVEISSVYWRQCYSYILCSTIAFFEQVHKEYAQAQPDEDRKKNTMVLTGVRGTGKSILGAIIGLFMAKLFGWEVHYMCNGNEIWAGNQRNEYKTLHIVDLSGGDVGSFPIGFLLIVSSANSERWRRLRKQQTWSETDGNFCFIDSASEREVEQMAANKGHDAVAAAKNAFEYVGGVPRLCLQNPDRAKQMVDGAISKYGMEMLVKHLFLLDDSPPRNEGSTAALGNMYPGLVGHIIPTDSFRKRFKLQIPSPYIWRLLMKKEDSRSYDKLQKLMKGLLVEPKARSFGGCIWEPLLTMAIKKRQADITIVGSELPVDSTEAFVEVLLQESASKMEFIEFTAMADFLEKAKEIVRNNNEDFTVFAKAKNETFAAIDAIIMIKRSGRLTIAALQLTVAEKHHPVKQSMIVEFVETCKLVDSHAMPQLWFLQPKECLPYFAFVKLQAMEFKALTSPDGQINGVRKKPRRQSGPNSVPCLQNAPNEKMQSNDDETYWHEYVRSLPQYIGIVQIDTKTAVTTLDKKQGEIQVAFSEALTAATGPPQRASSSDPVDPTLRCWRETCGKMEELETQIHESLMTAIRQDIDADQESLVDAGFVFS